MTLGVPVELLLEGRAPGPPARRAAARGRDPRRRRSPLRPRGFAPPGEPARDTPRRHARALSDRDQSEQRQAEDGLHHRRPSRSARRSGDGRSFGWRRRGSRVTTTSRRYSGLTRRNLFSSTPCVSGLKPKCTLGLGLSLLLPTALNICSRALLRAPGSERRDV